MAAPLYTRTKSAQQAYHAQPAGLSGGSVDPVVARMQATLRELGVSIRYPGRGWYEAWDGRGLVMYRWRHVDELLRQIRGEMELPEMTEPQDNPQAPEPDYSNGKDHKAAQKRRAPDNSTRAWVEPGIYRITYPSGATSFEVHATVDGKSKYGGRHPSPEAAREARDKMLGERGVQRIKPGRNHSSWPDSPVSEPSIPDSNLTQTNPDDPDQAELIKLFEAEKDAEAAYLQARCTFEEAVKAREAAWQALEAFLEAQRAPHTNTDPDKDCADDVQD